MLPFELRPAIKDYIWGGTRLRDEFGKRSDLERLAESWELSCHPDGMSTVASGTYEGKSLAELIDSHPEICGGSCRNAEDFPVLVKLIDARADLSVQVHPDDDYARTYENSNGKTEMWYIIDAQEGAELIYGFREKISTEEFRRAVEQNTLLDYVRRVPVRSGDVFFIKPGTLHAIGKGILIAEIQQSSNITYRVYDYGRLGADGKPRELHIDKALAVADTSPADTPYGQPHTSDMEGILSASLASCRYFTADRFDVTSSMALAPMDTFRHILVLDGEADITCGHERLLHITKGSSIFVPAGADMCYIKGKCRILITTTQYYKEEN